MLAKKLAVLVQVSALLAESVKTVILFHTAVVRHTPVGIEREGIPGKRTVKLCAAGIHKADAERILLDLKAKGYRGKDVCCIRLLNGRHNGYKPGAFLREERIQPVFPGSCGEHIGFLRKYAVKRYAQAKNLIGQKNELEIRTVGMQQESIFQRFHPGKF